MSLPDLALLANLRQLLAADAAEAEEGFRAEQLKPARLSLRLTGALQAILPAFLLLAGLSVIPVPLSVSGLTPSLALMGLGLATFAASLVDWSLARTRLLACLSVWLTAAILGWAALVAGAAVLWIEHYLLGFITLMTLGVAGTMPLRPWQTLVLGASVDTFYLVSWLVLRSRPEPFESDLGWLQHGFLLGVTVVATLLSAVVYRNRVANYRAHQTALRNAESLRNAQCRLLLAENAATMGRLAASLAHELNSPLGALTSAVSTLVEVSQRLAGASEEQRRRMSEILPEAQKSMREASARLREIVARIQRFTNLDRSEVQPVNLNELLKDVVLLIEPQVQGKVEFELDTSPVDALTCRPQQISAVFSNLVGNAAEAVGTGGRVRIATRQRGSTLEVLIEDNGRGMTQEELATVFDPGFRVSGTRISTGHWSLFSTRQMVHEHGGDIQIASQPGEGTSVRVSLPL